MHYIATLGGSLTTTKLQQFPDTLTCSYNVKLQIGSDAGDALSNTLLYSDNGYRGIGIYLVGYALDIYAS